MTNAAEHGAQDELLRAAGCLAELGASARVLIVDDDAASRHSVQTLTASLGLASVSFASAEEFLARGALQHPGCLILDVHMPQMDGLELLQHLRRKRSPLRVVIVTGYGDIPLTVKAMQAGAVGFLEKPFAAHELLNVIRNALSTAPEAETEFDPFAVLLASLTAEEHTILSGMAVGKSNTQMALQLDLSPRTVQFRRTSVMQKLGVRSREELMCRLFAAGWKPQG